jgi:hypothetical protein
VNSVEQAIRAALSKGDAGDQAFRRRIYGSASAALERSLSARAYTEAEIAVRRKSLLSTIRIIESEFLIAVEVDVPEVPAVVQPAEPRTAKVLDELTSQPANNAVEAPQTRERMAAKPVKIPAQRKNRPWFKYALNGGFLLVLVLGGFWGYRQGTRIYAEATTPGQVNQKPLLAENAESIGSEAKDWIQVFSARDTDLLSPAQGAKAEITSRDGNNYVVMTGDGTNEVAIKIGAGLMQTFAGKRVLFNYKARSVNGAILETGMHCAFGEDTICERKRFKIGPQTAEYMFAVTVGASVRGDGALLIAPDLTGGGGAVEIENIRATIVEPDAG